jgi:anti-anti-sigma regulatory factor
MLDVRANGSVFVVSGSLDAETAPRFLEAVRRADGDVRVDGSRLPRLDGAGLTALVVARRMCRERGRELVVVPVSPEARRGLRARREILRRFGQPVVAATATCADDLHDDPSPVPQEDEHG